MEKLSKESKKEAGIILKKTGLADDLSKFGKVFIMGSFELNLMVGGDIDVYLIDKSMDKKRSIKVLEYLIAKEKFDGYIYYDYFKKSKSGFPKGYYIGLKTWLNEKRWKVDLWLMNEMDKNSYDFLKHIKNRLNKKNKKLILKLKYQIKTKQLEIPSRIVYLAVLNNKIKNLKELQKAIKMGVIRPGLSR